VSVLLIDNYDSFTFNLYQQMAALGADVHVARNDRIGLAEIRELGPDAIVLSPGPGHPDRPRDFGVCAKVLAEYAGQLPILGVCLGHQGIVRHFGGDVVHAPEVVHGKSSRIEHHGAGLFAGIDAGPEVMRYHSLAADGATLPDCLDVTARSLDDGVVMAVSHREFPVHGVQFHPESIGTAVGDAILGNFLEQR
jgi:anthranilate synthase/aminodeoxychorismate synthase-like glutamine amidotransferase